MKRFVEGTDRSQTTLFPECLEDWICEDNPVRVIDVFVDELDLADLRFEGVDPEVTGRPSYHPSVLLKLYIYGYLNRVQSSRRLEREAGRIVSLIHPAVSAFPERVVGSACALSFSRLARRSLALRPAHSRCHQFVTRYPKAS